MLDIAALFPQCTPALSEAFEAAPKSLGAVNAAIDYKEALALDDPRYVPTAAARAERFQKLFYATLGYNPADQSFVPPASGKHVLFFGHVGCGKSTELTQMCAELHRRDRYWVVRIDLLDLIDPNDARYSDVWLAVAQQLVAQLQADGLQVPSPVLSRLENWFSEQVLSHEQVKELGGELKAEVEIGGGMPLIGKLLARFTSAIKTGSTYRDALRTVVRNTYGEFVGALNALLEAAAQAVREEHRAEQVLLVIDGTDRFRREDWQRFFVDEVNQLTLVRCVAVYTAPMALKASGARLDLFDNLVLPMIKLREFSGDMQRRPSAYEAMRAVLLKRCHASLFDRVETLDALIDHSGGHLRDALRLLSYACVEADGPLLGDAAVQSAAKRLAGDFRDWLQHAHYQLLVDAARDPENTGTSAEITLLVERGALLEYNTGSWRLPHPVIRMLSAYRRAEAMQPAEE